MIKKIDFKYLFFDFEGRISRKEYWIGVLSITCVGVLIGILGKFLMPGFFTKFFLVVLQLLVVVPSLALQIKRWHDRNKSGWWCLINLVPLIGGIWSFIELGFLESEDFENTY